MPERIIIEFEVGASITDAFEVWTERCSLWWPRSHSMSQSDAFNVVFEPEVGGRIYEVGPDGTEHEWGKVTVWEPPRRLEYSWHIFLDPDLATKVVVTFEETADGSLVRLENSGFEVFGEGAAERRSRVGSAWEGIIGRYQGAS